MRVAYVCADPGVPPFGRKGASVHLQAVVSELRRRGHDVQVVTTARVGTAPPHLADLRVHRVSVRAADDAAAREACLQDADAQVRHVLQRLHAQMRFDLVYERYSLWGQAAMTWARATAVPSVLEVNAPLVDEQATHRGLVDRAAAEAVAQQAMDAAGTVVCVSEAVAAWARRRTSRAVHVVPNGVDTRRVRPGSAPVRLATGTTFTVGFVGTLKPWHGVDVLCDAFALLAARDPTYRLLVVGDGPMADDVRRSAAVTSAVAGAVEMTGAVDPTEVPSLLGRMDVGTAPYPPLEDFYFSPLKLYEYLAAGVPVVASRVGDLAEVLDGGRLGVLVPPGSATALAAAVADLRADQRRREVLRREGRRRARERHDWARVLDTVLALAVPGSAPRATDPGRAKEVPDALCR